MLLAKASQLDTGNLGDGIPLIRGLERSCEQRLLLDRLLILDRCAAPRNNNLLTPDRQAVSITWDWILRFSSKKSTGYVSLA